MNSKHFLHASHSRPRPELNSTRAQFILRKCLALSLTAVCGLALPLLASAEELFVDGLNGSNTNDGRSRQTAFKTPWKAWRTALPGDTIIVMPTVVYGYQWFGTTAESSKTGGEPGRFITFRGDGAGSNMTKISGRDTFGFMLSGISYVRIENFDITASGHGDTAGRSGVYILDSKHIEIRNNYVHDSACSGIQTHDADHVKISGNHVANNAKLVYNNVYCSGISMHENKNTDSITGVKMEISNNLVYGNTNVAPEGCTSCTNSDGNGIIIDDSRRLQSDTHAYLGATLVDNNVVFGNGGRGLHVYQSDNVTARGNTFYQNNRDPKEGSWRPGEVSVIKSGGVKLYNNIFNSAGSSGTEATGPHVAVSIQYASGSPIFVNYSVSYNPQSNRSLQFFQQHNSTTVHLGRDNRWGNPQHQYPSLNPSVADFRVRTNSPALGFDPTEGSYPAFDFLFVKRSSPVTVGAYQTPVSKNRK